jgi:hypothetical protein
MDVADAKLLSVRRSRLHLFVEVVPNLQHVAPKLLHSCHKTVAPKCTQAVWGDNFRLQQTLSQ